MSQYHAAKLLQPGHPMHGKKVDISVRDGRIQRLEAASGKAGKAIDLEGCWVSAGWWDGQADFRDPGVERAEGLKNGLNAAAQGGFTRVAPVASTIPCRDQPSEVISLLHRASTSVCGVIPIASVSIGCAGKQLSEGFALRDAGARAFSDDGPLERPELLRRALEYHSPSRLPVFSEAHDPHFQPDGVMHEGSMSTAMGLPGNSEESELLRIGRDLDILRYAGGRLHFPVVTTAAGLNAIREAKAAGLDVSCGTTVHHLCWTEADLDGFNRDMKLMPPLRTGKDRSALREGALDGTLDMIVSDHRPRTPEEHDVDFMMVRPGIAGIHAVGPALLGAMFDHGASEQDAVLALHALLVSGPRKLLADPAEVGGLEEGAAAELTFFSTAQAPLPDSSSLAPNTVYGNRSDMLRGHIRGVVTPRGALWN